MTLRHIGAFVSLGLALAAPAPAASDYATKVLAYSGAGGVSGYNTHPEQTLGPPSTAATPTVPDNSSLFSFGWGGYITLGFDQPITDDARHPGGYDFIVFGNSMYSGGDTTAPHREPGYVEVGIDTTGRHEYGDGSKVAWYWLKGSPAPAALAGYPIALPDVSDTVIGYADCTPTDGTGNPLVPTDPTVPGIAAGSAGGDAFDLAWAVDANGTPAHITTADFVRITCAIDAVLPVFGRISTEVDAVSLVAPAATAGDVDADGRVTLTDATLVARAVRGLAPLTDAQAKAADMTGHGGAPTLDDLLRILRLSAGL